MTKKKQNIIAIIIVVAGVILSYAFFGSRGNILSENTSSDQESASTMVGVMALKKDGSFELEKNITFKSEGAADVLAEYAGRIETVNFKTGEFVKEGQILAYFEQSSEKNSAKLSYESAEKSLKIAEDNFEKTEKIAEESVEIAESSVDIAEEQYEQAKDAGSESAEKIAKEGLEIAKNQEDQARESAKTQINGAKLQLEQSKLQFQQAKIQYDKTFIKAPISGVISSKTVQPSDYLNPGMKIAEISGEGKVFAKIYLNEKEIKFITGDEKVYIQDGENRLGAEIDSFSKIAKAANGRYELTLMANDDINELVNRNVKAVMRINLAATENGSFFVPLNAVNVGQSSNQVFILEKGVAKAVEVAIEEIINDQARISGELEDGDLLIIEGNRDLQDGERVEADNNIKQ